MKVKVKYKFANLSAGGYRHFPFLYFAYGKDGFSFCLIGVTIIVNYE